MQPMYGPGAAGRAELPSLEFPQPSPARPQAPSFTQFLLEQIDHVNTMQQEAQQATEQLMAGEDVNTAEVLTAIQKADLTFRMMMQVRNKLIQAYQEVRDIRI